MRGLHELVVAGVFLGIGKLFFVGVVAAALVLCNSGCKKSERGQVLVASMTDNVELLKQMDAKEADLNAQYPERYNWTPLMAAILNNKCGA